MPRPVLVLVACLFALAGGCRDDQSQAPSPAVSTRPARQVERRQHEYKVVHVFVALCDNVNQGIAPVPAFLGNGQDPKSNLYWGAMYGVKTFFKRSDSWSLVKHATKPASPVLDRVVFRSTWAGQQIYVIADAYDGARMKTTLTDFMAAARGDKVIEVSIGDSQPLQGGAMADIVCFIGHNGLMEVSLGPLPRRGDGPRPSGAIVLACRSASYFGDPLNKAGCPLLLSTTGNMAPEAYTLDAALRSWAAGQTPQKTRQAAAHSYARYQKCSQAAAMRLFTSGQ